MDFNHEMILLLWAMVASLCLVCGVAGEIRCYCNDASCVRTGYMCKSAMGRCFSQLSYERDSTKSVHGCAENLPLQHRGVCEGSGNIAEAKTGERVQWPILLCCKNDMCNYMDNFDINIYVTKSNGSKDTVLAGSLSPNSPRDEDASSPLGDGEVTYPVDSTDHRDLWFKAAVIAVPIAGGFILVLLVLLAVRVLRNDNLRHRQLVQMRHHRSLAKAQLYVADHFYHNELVDSEKSCHHNANYNNHNNAKIKCQKNPSSSSSTSSTPSSSNSSSSSSPTSGTRNNGSHDGCHVTNKQSPLYRDVHIKIDNSKHRYEKIRPASESSAVDGTCSSVILWGDPDKTAASV